MYTQNSKYKCIYASKLMAYAIMNETCLLVSLSPSQDRDKFTSADL